jgi:hypothetical protein
MNTDYAGQLLMIYAGQSSAKGIGHTELFADTNCGRILDFTMPWNGTGSLSGGIVVDAVLGPFADKDAAICLQVAN